MLAKLTKSHNNNVLHSIDSFKLWDCVCLAGQHIVTRVGWKDLANAQEVKFL